MSLETGDYITDLVITNPTSSDPKSQGDDHFQLIKKVLKECLNGFTGGILLTATDTGTAAAHVLTPTTALVGYTTGLMLLYRPTNAGTGALTVNVSGLGAKSVKTIAGADPTSGDILVNQPILLMYDGTNFVLLAGSEYLSKTGNQTLTGNLTLTGNETISGTLGVTGATTLNGALTVAGVVTLPPTGTGTTEAVRKDYADGLAFSTTLPAQAGNSGKFVTTNGATASWGEPRNYATSYNTALVTVANSAAAPRLYDTLAIDSNRELLIFISATAVQAVVWNNATSTFGAMTLIRAMSAEPAVGSLLIGTDKALIVSGPASSTAFEAVVLTFSGTTITVNTAATQTLPDALHANTPDGKTDGFCHRGVACGSSYVFGMKLDTSARCIAITVSGTTPTIGTSLSLVAAAVFVSIRGIDSTRLLSLYISGANLAARPITVSAGTTLTAGTAATFTASAWRYFSALTTGRWAIAYTNTNSYGAIISVSGTVATASTVVLNAAADLGTGSVVKIGDQLVVQCSTTKVNVLTDVSGTATAGTAVTTQTMASTQACCAFGSDYVVFGGTTLYNIIKLSGNNPTIYEMTLCGANLIYSGATAQFDDTNAPEVLSSSTKSCIAYRGTTAPTVLTFNSSGPLEVRDFAPAGYSTYQIKSSDTVLWMARMPTTLTTAIRITRLEML